MADRDIGKKLMELGLEVRHVVFDENKRVFGGPHKKLSSLDTIDGDDYLRAITPDHMTGYYRRNNKAAFGSPHSKVFGFIEINGRQYLRAKGEDRKEGLYDSKGDLFNERNYDKITEIDSPLDELVLSIKDGDKEGFLLSDCSLFGMDNAMNASASLRKIGDEVCLWATDEEGNICIYSREGEVLYGGNHKEISVRKIGDEVCAQTKDDDEKECYYLREGEELYGGSQKKIEIIRIGDVESGEFCGLATNEEDGQCIFSRENEELYKGWHKRVGKPRKVPVPGGGDIFLIDVYDEEGLMLVERGGNIHFGDYHKAFLEGPSIDGMHESPSKGGMHIIDGEVYYAFEEFNSKICFWTYNNMPAFGGFHDELCLPSEDGRMGPLVLTLGDDPITSRALTALKFRDGKKIGYYTSDGTSLFRGQHEEEVRSFEWERETYILFKDAGRFIFSEFSGEKTVFGEYHDEIKSILRITFEKKDEETGDLEEVSMLFLEALDPVSFMRKAKRLFLSTPSTYYSFDGKFSFTSEKEIREHYGIPDHARFEHLKPTETIMMPAVRSSHGEGGLEAILGAKAGEGQGAEKGKGQPLKPYEGAEAGGEQEVLPESESAEETPAEITETEPEGDAGEATATKESPDEPQEPESDGDSDGKTGSWMDDQQ